VTVLAPALAKPADTARPTIKGTAKYKNTVTADAGRWTGTPPITFRYQWKACKTKKASTCKAIRGATRQTFTVTKRYVGDRLEVVVTAIDAAGRTKVTSRAARVL
jgi:hypothetical protein